MKRLKKLKMFILAVSLTCGVHILNVSAMEKENSYDIKFDRQLYSNILKLKDTIKRMERDIVSDNSELNEIKRKKNEIKEKKEKIFEKFLYKNYKVYSLENVFDSFGGTARDEVIKLRHELNNINRELDGYIRNIEEIEKQINTKQEKLNIKYDELKKLKEEFPKTQSVFFTEPEELNDYGYDSDDECKNKKKEYKTIDYYKDYKKFARDFDIYREAAYYRALKNINMKRRDILKKYKKESLITKEEYDEENNRLKKRIEDNKEKLSKILKSQKYNVNDAYVNKDYIFDQNKTYIENMVEKYKKQYDDFFGHMIKREVIKYERSAKKRLERRKKLMDEGISMKRIQKLEEEEQDFLKGQKILYDNAYDRYCHYDKLYELAKKRAELLNTTDPRSKVPYENPIYENYSRELHYFIDTEMFWLEQMRTIEKKKVVFNKEIFEKFKGEYEKKYDKMKEEELKRIKEDEERLESMDSEISSYYLLDVMDKYRKKISSNIDEIRKQREIKKDLNKKISLIEKKRKKLIDKHGLLLDSESDQDRKNSMNKSFNLLINGSFNDEEEYKSKYIKTEDVDYDLRDKNGKLRTKIVDLKAELMGVPMNDKLRIELEKEVEKEVKKEVNNELGVNK